ncbi:MAG: peptidoglycan editing factor PgeF [Clostridia bacterium]|nr:peptidoglycan editing factor PgeF [Clostridia bacterium]
MISKTVDIKRSDGVLYIEFPKLAAAQGVRHIFSTREGGVSPGARGSMNLSFRNGDSRENVEENYRRICKIAGIDVSHLVLTRQTHTNNVITVGTEHRGTGYGKPEFSDVDGLITDTPGVALVTQFADCVPLLFYDPVARVIANSHSGWRGTVQKIGAVTVRKMVNGFGSRPENIIAAIGPAICKDCYEVDTRVFLAFKEAGFNLSSIFTPKPDGEHYLLDLIKANKEILLDAGIRPENLDIADLCTAENSSLLHSHRATAGKRGNLAAIIEMY